MKVTEQNFDELMNSGLSIAFPAGDAASVSMILRRIYE